MEQTAVGTVEGLSVEIKGLLKRKGLRGEDFIEWLGTQRQNGSDLKNWTSEELFRSSAYYSEVYGVKAPPAPVPNTTTQPATSPVQPAPNQNAVVTESGNSHDSSLSGPDHASTGGRNSVTPGDVNDIAVGPVDNPVASSQPVQTVRMEK